MSALSTFLHKQRMRWHGRGIDRVHELRRRLSYYVAKHGFEIGDYSLGDPTVQLFSDSRLIIGKYSSVAEGAVFVLGGNHRTDFVTTSLLDRSSRIDPRALSRGDIVVGSDVWIASNATILSGVMIGDGAVVGAGAVVLDDVPPYGIVLGNPARLVRKRFSDAAIAELLALRWWDLPRAGIEQLAPLLHSDDVDAFIAACRKLKGLPPRDAASRAAIVPRAVAASSLSRDDVLATIRSVFPAVTGADLDKPLDDAGVDSFGLVALRTALETKRGGEIDDAAWTTIATLDDAVRLAAGSVAKAAPSGPAAPATTRRVVQLNMPQMMLGGLSESWLFKEAGDIHWHLITQGLDAPSSQLRDTEGNRLYATFTRVRLDATAPLAVWRENETVALDATISRYGAGMFFDDVAVTGEGKSATVRVMSSFSRFGESGTNMSLLKGQPDIPAGCQIPALDVLPAFAQAYRAQRGVSLAPPLFSTEYDLIPVHDINGVGLLYFAAYPVINDICAMRHAGREAFSRLSTSRRDVFYFANCDPSETLVYRLHRWDATDTGVDIEESLSRRSDGVLMAYTATRKERVAG